MIIHDIILFNEDFNLSEKIKWEEDTLFNSQNIYFFRARLFNNNINRKKFSLGLKILYDVQKNYCLLFISGKLENWFFQEEKKEKLTGEEYKNCLILLHSELDLEFKERQLIEGKHLIMDSKNGEYKYRIIKYYLSENKLNSIGFNAWNIFFKNL